MQLIAAKSMTYATRRLAAGDLFHASPRDARLLVKLKRASHAPAAAEHAVTIPDDWKDMDWPEMKSLAASLSPTPIKTKADATAAIEAEVGRRAR